MKLRKLRAMRGQPGAGPDGQQQVHHMHQQQQPMRQPTSVSADLDSIRALFNEKEKELGLAVRKVEDLTHQLEDLRTGRVNNHYPPQMVELERLRRELAYRKQLNEQQNNMIAQQRDQLSRGHEEIAKIGKAQKLIHFVITLIVFGQFFTFFTFCSFLLILIDFGQFCIFLIILLIFGHF